MQIKWSVLNMRYCFEGNGVAFFWLTMTGGAADPEEHLAPKIGSFHA